MKTLKEEREAIVKQFYKMMDDNLWRDANDPTISMMAIGNVEDWLRTALAARDAAWEEKTRDALKGFTVLDTIGDTVVIEGKVFTLTKLPTEPPTP